MKNIVTHEKLDNGKTLLIATNMPKVLYDEKECQFIVKKYKKRVISDDKKDTIAYKLSYKKSISLHSKVESDELISYFFYDGSIQIKGSKNTHDVIHGVHIIISKKEPFIHVSLYPLVSNEILKAFNEKKHLEQAKEILDYVLCQAKEQAPTIIRYLGTAGDRAFYCRVCEKWLEFNDFEDIQNKTCECGATHEITLEKVIRARVKEV